jgi:hypothetical protein
MNTTEYDSLINMFERLIGKEETIHYSPIESVKSIINTHVYNINPRKKKFFASFFATSDMTHLFPKEHGTWILSEVNCQKKNNQKYLCSAHYIRDFTEEDHVALDKFFQESEYPGQ